MAFRLAIYNVTFEIYFRFAVSAPDVVVFSGHTPGPGDVHVITGQS